jgi:hypothetical protein
MANDRVDRHLADIAKKWRDYFSDRAERLERALIQTSVNSEGRDLDATQEELAIARRNLDRFEAMHKSHRSESI